MKRTSKYSVPVFSSSPFVFCSRLFLYLNSGLMMALLVSALRGCDQDRNDYAKQKPRVEDVAGTYRPDTRTTELLSSQGHYPQQLIEIHLEKNGRAQFYNIPDWWRDWGDSHGKFDTGFGTWALKSAANEWGPEKQRWVVETTVRWRGREYIDDVAFIDLRGQKPPYVLQMIIGDPDQMNAMHFERKSEAK